MKQTKNIAITTQQRTILTLIYRFRFVSTKHIQQALGIKYLGNAQPRLQLLVTRGLIGRNYTGAQRLQGIPASYYLLPDGMRALKQHVPGANHSVLHSAYKDKSASEGYIKHCLMVGDANLEFEQLYGPKLEFFTKSESKGYDYIPNPMSDAYIRITDVTRTDEDPMHFFLEICEDSTLSFLHKKRIQQYIEYAEEGEWEAEAGSKLPVVLLVCESDSLRHKLQRMASAELENSFEEDLSFRVITKEQISSLTDLKNKARKS